MSFHIYLRSSSKFWPRSSVGGHKEIELLPELVARTRSFLLGKVVPPKVDRVYNERIRARVHHVVGDEEVKARYRDAFERDPPAWPVRNGEVRPGRCIGSERLKSGSKIEVSEVFESIGWDPRFDVDHGGFGQSNRSH